MRVLVTGSAGFIGSYLVQELLRKGHHVTGIDDLSKYGKVSHFYDSNPRFHFVEGDAGSRNHLVPLALQSDYIIAGAAMIGGISYFHTLPFDLFATNERIMATTCEAAVLAHKEGRLRRLIYISSSMVYESATSFPSVEGDELKIPPPPSSYGFQKLAGEKMVRAMHEQYGVPYTIVRPFNCVGVGETDTLPRPGNIRLGMTHVVPDLARKILWGQSPLRILGSGEQVRHYTYGGDIAKGIVTAMLHPAAENEDFNISSNEQYTVREVANKIWSRLRPGEELKFEHLPPYPHDVQRRIPSTEKARKVLGFEATTKLDDVLTEVIDWLRVEKSAGRLSRPE